MAKIPITVCIIARNEEEHIEQCLQHLKKYDWEIVVTDTGSTDRTKEIAAKYADRVLDFEWIDDFAAARNYCASFARNNWILVVDCDEYVMNADISALRILMQRHPRYVGVMRLTNLIAKDSGGMFPTMCPGCTIRTFTTIFFRSTSRSVRRRPARIWIPWRHFCFRWKSFITAMH